MLLLLMHTLSTKRTVCLRLLIMAQRLFRRKLVSQLVECAGGSVATQVGRPVPRVLERLTGRPFLEKIVENGK